MKLTRVQSELLRDVQNAGSFGVPVAESYKPAQALVRLGLASLVRGKWGNDRLFLTEAGATQITEAMKR